MRKWLGGAALTLFLVTCGEGDGNGTRPVSVASVLVLPGADTLVVADTLRLSATPQDEAGNALADRPVAWSSSDSLIARVSDAGIATGVAPGLATVQATSEGRVGGAVLAVFDGGRVGAEGGTITAHNGAVVIAVPPDAVTESVAITVEPSSNHPPDARLLAGTSFALGPDGTGFATPASLTIRYSATALSPGATESALRLYQVSGDAWEEVAGSRVHTESATVSAPITTLGMYAILVPGQVAHVTVAPPAATVPEGQTVQLDATATDAASNVLSTPVAWQTNRLDIATVDENGLVTGVAPGTATITATTGGKSGSAQITVSATSRVARMGAWTAPFPWPIVAVHLNLLPTGKVLSWGKKGQPHLWDPATGAFTERALESNLFCAGHSFLPDGRLLVTGGHIADGVGLKHTNIFDPATETWTRMEDMSYGRWYPTQVTLPNGEVVTHSGEERFREVPTPEVWELSGGYRLLNGASRVHIYYPRMFVAPNGLVFYAGEERTTSYLDPSGTGSWTEVGQRAFPRLRNYGSAVMYEPGKVLYVGGGLNPPTNTAEVIDLNQARPVWRYTNPMQYARRHHTATLLPDGAVLVTGGTSGERFNNPVGAVHAAELWNPATEQWRTLATNRIVRIYHGTSLLLPDARVLHAGSGDANVYDGSGPAPDERNAEIFSPPYLFNADGSPATRPTIANAPASVGYGQPFFVGTPDAATIRNVTWIRLGSVTHAHDMNQRLNRLDFVLAADGLNVTAPANANLAPPGHYLLFILNEGGVPSVARVVRIG